VPKDLQDFQNLSRSPLQNHIKSAMAAVGTSPKVYRHPLASFETQQTGSWISRYLSNVFGPRHDFLDASAAPNRTSTYKGLPDNLHISIVGDWGTGTDESAAVAQQMMKWDDGTSSDITIHLGDVYFVGDRREVEENCLGGRGNDAKLPSQDCVSWPLGTLGTFALNGNHEMYARGFGYFDVLLPQLGMPVRQPPIGQGPSFFCLENSNWRILGLDTGYNSVGWPVIERIPWFAPKCALRDELIAWLRNIVRPKSEPKANILLSHHQYFSAFPDETNYPKPASQLEEFFNGETVLWLWGHEHRFAGYKLVPGKFNVHARCIGHGGMPIERKDPIKDSAFTQALLFYDNRVNPLYQTDKLGFNGFNQLILAGDKLMVTYKSLAVSPGGTAYAATPDVLLTETFHWDGNTLRLADFNPKSLNGFVTP
jgi:hypothetical protein